MGRERSYLDRLLHLQSYDQREYRLVVTHTYAADPPCLARHPASAFRRNDSTKQLTLCFAPLFSLVQESFSASVRPENQIGLFLGDHLLSVCCRLDEALSCSVFSSASHHSPIRSSGFTKLL